MSTMVAAPIDQLVTTRLADPGSDADRWQAFVARQADSTGYHAWAWKFVFEKTFGWKAYYLIAEQSGEVCGVLPLIWQRNWPLTSVLSSMPHVKGGGILANSVEAAEGLLHEAQKLAHQLKADCIELRHASLLEPCVALSARTDKVTFVLPLEREEDRMLKALDKKTRNMVRKSMSHGLTAEFDNAGSLDAFYRIFCQNMRELGSPAYSKKFFREIQQAFPENIHICIVRHEDKPIAAAFLCGFRNTIEAIWACSLYKYLDLKPNMFMYWNMFRFAAQRGYDMFDFGRCSIGSGTYHFKMQWGAREMPLYWHYWRRDGAPISQPKATSSTYRFASSMWQRMPLGLTNMMGPRLIKYLQGV